MRKINRIILHCSATPEGRDYTVEHIRKWHLANGWKDIGYHFVIYRDGSIHFGRPIEQAGAHTSGYNKDSIGICYIGGCDSTGKKAKDTRTPEQKEAMFCLVKVLKDLYNVSEIKGHRDYSPDKNGDGKITKNEWIKACPSFEVSEWLQETGLA